MRNALKMFELAGISKEESDGLIRVSEVAGVSCNELCGLVHALSCIVAANGNDKNFDKIDEYFRENIE